MNCVVNYLNDPTLDETGGANKRTFIAPAGDGDDEEEEEEDVPEDLADLSPEEQKLVAPDSDSSHAYDMDVTPAGTPAPLRSLTRPLLKT